MQNTYDHNIGIKAKI